VDADLISVFKDVLLVYVCTLVFLVLCLFVLMKLKELPYPIYESITI